MSDRDPLVRIADALERLAPPPIASVDMKDGPAWHWDGKRLAPVAQFRPLPLDLIKGVERQKAALLENSRRHGNGAAAHDVLLWGARGMGKSALVKAVVGELIDEGQSLALVEAPSDSIATLPALFGQLAASARPFLLFIDDIAFSSEDQAPRLIRSMLEGGTEARPENVRLCCTSNRRNIVERNMRENEDAINQRDEMDDKLALADRFGLKLGFQYPDQEAWLAMVEGYAAHFDLSFDREDALTFAHSRGQRSGRLAWHYAVEMAGRQGKRIP